MTQNQQNKTCEPALLALRQDIDKIDDQIISLLKARMEVVTKVGEFKKNNQEKFFIRSNREADMIKNLVEKSKGVLSSTTVMGIWRKIITAANMHEQPLRIAIHNPRDVVDYAYLVREYYNDLVPIRNFDSVSNVALELEKGEAQIGIREWSEGGGGRRVWLAPDTSSGKESNVGIITEIHRVPWNPNLMT